MATSPGGLAIINSHAHGVNRNNETVEVKVRKRILLTQTNEVEEEHISEYAYMDTSIEMEWTWHWGKSGSTVSQCETESRLRHMCKMKTTKNIITRQQLVENGEVIGAVQQRGAATMESGHSWPMTVANPAQPGRTKLMHSTACEGRPAAAHTPSRHQWLMMSAWAVA